ncbi:MAG: response regulator [Candidatus Aureabacteria bacterium]|nr:response regulator [Candidatus Auribacterota bacterium]
MPDDNDLNQNDRREHPRYNVQYLACATLHGKKLGSTIIDISESGAGILLPKEVHKGEQIDITVRCGPSKEHIREINLKTKVVWIDENENDDDDMCRAGLQIIDVAPKDLEILKKNIQEISGRQKRIAGIEISERVVLIIEDTKALSYILMFDLQKKGFSTILAEKGEKGIELAKNELPDIILLDVMLPGINGFEVCRRLKEDDQTKKIPIIIMSVKSQSDDILRGLDAGADAYIVKSHGFEKLYERILELI